MVSKKTSNKETPNTSVIAPTINPKVPSSWIAVDVGKLPDIITGKVDVVDCDAENLASERHSVFEQLSQKLIGKDTAISMLGVRKSRFYELWNDYKSSVDFLGMVEKKKGPSKGSTRLSPEQRGLIQNAYDEHYKGLKATFAKVFREANDTGKKNNVAVTQHAVRTFLLAKGEKELYYRKYGKEAGDQKFKHKPRKKIFTLPLQQVLMDHTQVDIILVDEQRRDVLIGRPWVTMLICAVTRVIIGFYLSMFNPNVSTVSAALVFSVLNKDWQLMQYCKNPEEYPFFGIPRQIYTDNAAEFTSGTLIAKCRRWGMEWDHRPVDKKWYGGIIERVIGTFMNTGVHFLPGATGSNVSEREFFESEKNASMDFIQFCEWFLNQVTLYHGIKHSALGCTPRQAWDYYKSLSDEYQVRLIDEDSRYSFCLDFMPSSYNHFVNGYGINFARRKYDCSELSEFQGQKVDIRYNPNDLKSIWVHAGGCFIPVPCTYTRAGLSDNWESYKHHVQLTRSNRAFVSIPNGAVDDIFAPHAMELQRNIIAAAKQETAEYARSSGNILIPQSNLSQALEYSSGVSTSPEDISLDSYRPKIIIDPYDI
ncbi:transposase [Pseudomonas umsongensis]